MATDETPIITGIMQFGAYLSRKSLCVLLLFTFCRCNKTHKSSPESTRTMCAAADVNEMLN